MTRDMMTRRGFIVGTGALAAMVAGAAETNAGRFPTVVEGKVENGRLRLLVHDVFNGRVVLDRVIA